LSERCNFFYTSLVGWLW